MKELSLASRVPLQGGTQMPVLGLGTWKMAEGRETEEAVRDALAVGYRHIDTAKLYGNEQSVGKAVRESLPAPHSTRQAGGIPREEIFVTTKLLPTDFFNPERAFRASFERLGVGAIDLYLVHWPIPLMPKKVWQTLERMYEEGATRAIGVSNYGIDDIEKLLTYARVPPMVNQVEFNPASHDLELLAYCKKKNIVVQSYSPLGRGKLINNKTVCTFAEKYKKTPAQILIRWALEHGTVPLPKSSHKKRIVENTKVFDFSLTPEDIETLNSLG